MVGVCAILIAGHGIDRAEVLRELLDDKQTVNNSAKYSRHL
jgi:hypothetical protein